MIRTLDRTNTSLIGRWWWTVDRSMLIMLLALMMAGLLLVLLGSPSVAETHGRGAMYFFNRQAVFVACSIGIMFLVSLLNVTQVMKLSLAGLIFSLAMMVAVFFFGETVKGSTRWINFGSLSVQPSEFMKPCLAVVMAWLFSERYHRPGFRGWLWGTGICAVAIALLIKQPDFGMTVVVFAMWGGMFFLSGMPLKWIFPLVIIAGVGFALAYVLLPHVTDRVNNFMDPSAEGNYQVEKSLAAFKNGGLTGVGPGEGMVKRNLPDAHTDFIFAVAGEELGMLSCLGIMSIIGGIVCRGMWRARGERDLFIMLAASGLLMLFGIQSLINMGVELNMMPTKGMTMPLVSYGGSSTFAYALNAGMVLALTRRRFGK